MEVKQAVTLAKQHIAELFADEGAKNLGLEEVEFDESAGVWRVTIGFSRPWDEPRNVLASLAGEGLAKRTYKIVNVLDSDGQVLSVKTYQSRS